MKYRWLHVSDLHSFSHKIKTKVMLDSLIEELRDLNQKKKFSFLLITGDISNQNKGYAEAKELIYRIMESINLDKSKVFIIPGNHDVDREKPIYRNDIIQKLWKIEGILDDEEEKAIETLIPGQEDFFEAYENILESEYPREKIHFFRKLDDNIGIIHLNTSWMCGDSSKEPGKLHIGIKKFFEVFENEEIEKMPIKIVIGHHRMEDLNINVKNYLRNIFKSNGIDFYLGGHCHNAFVNYDMELSTEFCSCRQVPVEHSDYPAGFVVGDIDTKEDQSNLRFYKWHEEFCWAYDYSVNSAKHGKYYLKNEKFTSLSQENRDIVIDFKLLNTTLNQSEVIKNFNIINPAIYETSMKRIKPQELKDWDDQKWSSALQDIKKLYENVIKDSAQKIHIFPIAPIPLLVSFGYFLQNDNADICIYQFNEIEEKWVWDENEDDIVIEKEFKENGNKRLALALSVSQKIEIVDIDEVLGNDYDLFSIGIHNPALSRLNFKSGVKEIKKEIGKILNEKYNKYNEIHLFLAAPAGLCIEIGRIIRESMYPDTFIYNYKNSTNSKKYSEIFNLKEL